MLLTLTLIGGRHKLLKPEQTYFKWGHIAKVKVFLIHVHVLMLCDDPILPLHSKLCFYDLLSEVCPATINGRCFAFNLSQLQV